MQQKIALQIDNNDDEEKQPLFSHDTDDEQDMVIFTDKMKKELIGSKIVVRCQDKLPWGLRHLVYIFLFIIAILIDITLLLPLFILLIIISYIDRYIFCECCGCNLCGCGFQKEINTELNIKKKYIPSHLYASFCICCCTPITRKYFGKIRMSLLPHMQKNNYLINCFSGIIGIYQIIEFILAFLKTSSINAKMTYVINLVHGLGNDFGTDDNNGYIPFSYGIGILNYKSVKKHIHDPNGARKHFIFTVTTKKYHPLSSIGLNTNTIQHKNVRSLMNAFLSVFMHQNKSSLINKINYLQTILPRNKFSTIAEFKKSVANAMFYILMGKELNISEQNMIERFVSFGAGLNVIPSYIHFFLGGFIMERYLQNQIETVRNAFIKNMETKSIKLLYDQAIKVNINPDIAFRNVLLTFTIAGMGGVANLCPVIASRIKENPQKYIPLYYKNKDNFIRECARLNPNPPLVTIMLNENKLIEIAGIKRNVPKGTPISLFICSAHRDPHIFGGPTFDQKYANTFDPNRPNLDKILTWNALESLFINNSVHKKSPRYCPGHNLALFIVKAVIDNFCQDFGNINNNNILIENDENKNVNFLDTLDTQTKFTLYGSKLFLKEWTILTDESIKIPIENIKILKKIQLFGINVPYIDEDLKDDLHQKARKLYANFVTSKIFQITNELHEFESASQGIDIIKHIYGNLWPTINTDWNKYQNGILTDYANELFIFYGIGLWLTSKIINYDNYTPNNAYWICDARELGTFPTRNDTEFERLGASAYFDQNRKLIGIYSCVDNKYFDAVSTNNNKPFKWLHIKWLFRCSVCVKVTLDEHLLKCHLLESNTLDICCREQLPPNHPLRRFFKPFIFRTTYINNLATTFLVSEYGLIHRAFCYSYETLGKIMNQFIKNRKFEILPEYYKNNGITEAFKNNDLCPVYSDSMKLWNIHHKFIKKYLNIYYPNKENIFNDKYIVNFIKQMHNLLGIKRNDKFTNYNEFLLELTQMLMTVTGLHEYLGNLVEYKMRPDIYCGVVRYNKNMSDMHSYAHLISLGAFTGPKTPKLYGDFTHLLLKDDNQNKTKQIFNKWQKSLRDLSNEINEKNKNNRILPFNAFNPQYLECSVSI